MSAESLLKSFYHAQLTVQNDAALLKRMRESLEGSAVDYSRPIIHGGKPQNMGDSVINIVGLEERLQKSIKIRNKAAKRVLDLIDAVEDERLHLLLTLRYRDFLGWAAIAEKMNYSDRQLRRLHKVALRMVSIKMSESAKKSKKSK